MGAAASRPRTLSKRGSFWSRKKKAAQTPSPPPNGYSAPGDVTSGADIVLNSTVHKAEEPQHRAREYDEILAWLDWEFRKSDANKDGSLDYHEFMRFVRSLKLNMTTRELYTFYALADRDNDERIVWSEIEQEVPLILAKIYQGLSPSPADWCTMILPSTKKEEEEQVVYFNKRTSEVRRVRPAEMDAPAAPLSAPASPAAKEVVLENTRTFDSLVTWLDWEFKKADFDRNGTLSREEVASLLHSLRLGLTRVEVERFSRLADLNGDGVVEWKEVLEMTPLLFQKLYSGIEPGPHDFCVITDAEQRVHFLNKRTGAVTSEPPPGFVALPPDEETEEEAEATVTNKPKAEAETTSADSLEEGPSFSTAIQSLATSSSADGDAGEPQRLGATGAEKEKEEEEEEEEEGDGADRVSGQQV